MTQLYVVEPKKLKDIENRFTYHPPLNEGQVERYSSIRAAGLEVANLLLTYCPESRELSLALTKLEEAIMWANASIARNEKELGEE